MFQRLEAMRFDRAIFLIMLLGLVVGGVAFAADTATMSSSDIITAKSAPVRASQWAGSGVTTLTTTPAYPLAADPSETVADTTLTQNIRIFNRHATNVVCFKPFAFATSCSATCAASGMTCNGTANTDGDPIGPGQPYTIAIGGDACGCWMANAAGTTATYTRVQRKPL